MLRGSSLQDLGDGVVGVCYEAIYEASRGSIWVLNPGTRVECLQSTRLAFDGHRADRSPGS